MRGETEAIMYFSRNFISQSKTNMAMSAISAPVTALPWLISVTARPVISGDITAAMLLSADSTNISPMPRLFLRTSCQRRISVPRISLGFTTTRPLLGRAMPLRLDGGGVAPLVAIGFTPYLRSVYFAVKRANAHQLIVRAKAAHKPVFKAKYPVRLHNG